MSEFRRESWEDFQKRMGVFFDGKTEGRDEDEYWASFFYFSSMFCSEQKLNWRRHIVRMKKVLKIIRSNGSSS